MMMMIVVAGATVTFGQPVPRAQAKMKGNGGDL